MIETSKRDSNKFKYIYVYFFHQSKPDAFKPIGNKSKIKRKLTGNVGYLCFPIFASFNALGICQHMSLGFAPVARFPQAWHRLVVSHTWHGLHIFSSLASPACCPAFDISCLSRVWHQAGACCPAFGTSSMLSRVWHQWHVVLHLAPVACCFTFGFSWEGTLFPAFDTSCMFPLVWLWVHCLPHLTLVQRIHYNFRLASNGLFLRAFYLIMR